MAVEYKIIGGDGGEYTPESLEELRQWCSEGRVGPGTPVWRGDERKWAPAGSRDELRWDLPKPEAPPQRPPGTIVVTPVMIPAGFWVRLAAYLFDMMLVGSLITVLMTPWADWLKGVEDTIMEQTKSATPDLAVVIHGWLVLMAINLPAQFLYFVAFNTAFGATPGKMALGLRILDAQGGKLTFKRAFLRHCSVLVSEMTFGLGFLLLLSNPDRRALHDLMAGTRVVFLGWRRDTSKESMG
jgi:uncharacterized RDD family membrane protein YckC